VQGVLTSQQSNLPVRHGFLDHHLEPEFSSGWRNGPPEQFFFGLFDGRRTDARIEVDGIDISDETVGTTTQNSLSALSESATAVVWISMN
jgi:hypothetical protein